MGQKIHWQQVFASDDLGRMLLVVADAAFIVAGISADMAQRVGLLDVTTTFSDHDGDLTFVVEI